MTATGNRLPCMETQQVRLASHYTGPNTNAYGRLSPCPITLR